MTSCPGCSTSPGMSRQFGFTPLVYIYCNPWATGTWAQPFGKLRLSSPPHLRWVRSPLPLGPPLRPSLRERLGLSRPGSLGPTLALALSLPRPLPPRRSLWSWLGSWLAASLRPALGVRFRPWFRSWLAQPLALLLQALRGTMSAKSTYVSFGRRTSTFVPTQVASELV